eukprot:TRINITY_DN10311_c0_g1_i1.p1 TRINITY_DN10311_c0_g1~~TRINITY_DN10311_c0_g1_i1.p1  ORF type:complete len:325 (-),score=40.14 TRINITY_DN10311_c0_g1_i1:51-974(-)
MIVGVFFVLFFSQCLSDTSVNPNKKVSLPPPPCGNPCKGPSDCSGNCSSCRLGYCVGEGKCNSYCDPAEPISMYCYNDYCQYCDPSTSSCRSTCGGPCVDADQCTASSCPKCNNYICSSVCGAKCTSTSDCASDPDLCTKCINGTCQKPTGCQSACNTNDDCIHNTDTCTKCIRNVCVPGGCNSICYYTPDCFGQGNCTQCYGRFYPGGYGVCTASCGLACGSNEQCNGTLTNCGLCKNNVCSPSDVCGIACINDVGCAGNCHRCINGTCTKNATCGQACQVNTQCDQTDPKCMYCINSKCGAPESV